MMMTTLDNLLAQARAQIDLRRQLNQLEQEQQEQADRALNDHIWAALEVVLPAPLLEYARFEVDTRDYYIRTVNVTLNLDAIQAAPITFTLIRGSDDRPWTLRTTRMQYDIRQNDGYCIASSWCVEWDEYGDGGWYVQPHGLRTLTTDIIEALSYALEAWPDYDAACQEVRRRNEACETPPRARPLPQPTLGEQLLLVLDQYIARHTEDV
jgi:hypothetical protein